MTLKALPFFLGALSVMNSAHAEPDCGAVEVRFKPGAKNMQIVVWIEDASGQVVATPYITRVTGQFGLGNRPGAPLLKTNFRWPYGRREMVAPVWAHRRNKHYPKVVMGGVCGNSPASKCPDGSNCAGQCEDSTIAYHERVSTHEPFYCPPSEIVDAVSCASPFTGSKGAYAAAPAYSLYPPRADLTNYNAQYDSPDLNSFAAQNDLVAVSAATPLPNAALNPPVSWFAAGMPAGDYVAFIELSAESDFNAAHNHPNAPDSVSTWDFEGREFLGQPSIVYRVPFRYDVGGDTQTTNQYAGYGAWDGADGILRAPDATITTNKAGSGAGRLLEDNDGADVFRAKVVVGVCTVLPTDGGASLPDGGAGDAGSGCDAPEPVSNLALTPAPNKLLLSFRAPANGPLPTRYEVRYRESKQPIRGETFEQQVAGPTLPSAPLGEAMSAELTGLLPNVSYAVAVRAVSSCGRASATSSHVAVSGAAQFAVLHGCFVATAAFGTPLAASVQALRSFRDHHLLSNPAGRLFTALYYSFSQPLARAIASDEHLRSLARAAIAPLVELAAAARAL